VTGQTVVDRFGLVDRVDELLDLLGGKKGVDPPVLR
jgi:hypothetical protein